MFKDHEQEILRLLGENKPLTPSFILHPIVHKRWANILANGLDKEDKQEFFEKFHFQDNLFLGLPRINQEIISAIATTALKNDRFFQYRQTHLGKATAALGRALNIALSQGFDQSQKSDLAKLLNESAKEDFLFASNLGEKLKEAKTLQQASTHIKSSSNTANKSLNWRGPPRSRGDQGPAKGQQQP
ncbi:hypothetical protein ABEB36_015612 [Hypothenemus hampei]|uniref:Uncharacterized protein n=1 Tax=Hypothenemus hampei TaxID=57062 RepID=A0ABD1E006_HYPHA